MNTKWKVPTPDNVKELEKCKICKNKVHRNDKALSCDVCLQWWHATKCLKLTEDVYNVYSSDNTSWFCDNCKGASKGLRNHMVFMQQRIEDLESKVKILEEQAISREEASDIITEELRNEETTQLIEEAVNKKIEEIKPKETKKTEVLHTVKEYISDLSDADRRASNLIIHKLEESTAEAKEDQENEDKTRVTEILKAIKDDLQAETIKKITRLGQKQDNARPILVQLDNKTTSSFLIKNAKKLKDTEWSVGIGMDLPKTIRQVRKFILDEAKEKTPDSENFLFRLVGEPGKERVVKSAKKTEGT